MKLFGKTGTAGCNLSEQEKERYARQIQLTENGEKMQCGLKNASVLVIGAGGLGSAVLPYLAGAGIGRIGIVDNDVVSLSNLQRQTLYKTSQIGKSKALKAKKRLQKFNPEIRLEAYNIRLTAENAAELFQTYDLIIDCTDNLSARYVIDSASRETGKPFIYGSVCEYSGQVSVFNYQNGLSYSDIYPHSPEVENYTQPSGIFGAVAGIVGAIQAMEAINLLLHRQTLSGYLLLIDMQEHTFRKIKIG